MKILTDRHHADLLYALQRLFEDRLGYELYIPLGHEWWDAGIWQFGTAYGDDRLARQYLNIDARYREIEPGLFLTFDNCHPERPIYGVTLEYARLQSWDVVMPTVQENQIGFHKFAQENNAQYLYHIGNARQGIDTSLVPIIIDQSQEFDYKTTFRFREPTRLKRVVSFVNLLSGIPQSWEPFARLKDLLPSYQFRSFGHNCPDGFLTPVAAIAEEMAHASWAYHDKPTGDGFGHIIHNWAAIGRPLIGHARYYEGQRAEVFWRDGITCLDLDKHSPEAAAQLIAAMTPEGHWAMCRAIRKTFEQVYDPKLDALEVRAHLRGERTEFSFKRISA